MENSKSTDELLEEILKYQKRSSRITRIAAIAVLFIACVFAVALALIIPKVVNILDNATETLEEVDELIADTGDIMDDLNDYLLLTMAVERMSSYDPSTLVSEEDVDRRLGITQVELDSIGEVEFE